MPKPAKKFVDKHKSVSFHLVHRSQQDPLVADEDAPQHVLLPTSGGAAGDNLLLSLPDDVFASKQEDKDGMLSRAAPVTGPQLHLDPDVVAAMDDDFDYNDPDNQLEDDFIQIADGVLDDNDDDDDTDYSDEDEDDFNDEETKSRFTSYSMTSSVIQRNDQLSLLDDRFEKMYADYDENEIGALDCEEIEGFIPDNSTVLLQYADEFQKNLINEKLDKNTIITEQVLDEDNDLVDVEIIETDQFDCQSILSTYSNIYNHPKLIREQSMNNNNKIRVNRRTGIALLDDRNKLTKKALSQQQQQYNNDFNNDDDDDDVQSSVISQLSILSVRPKNESPEERKERKKCLKNYRKERRLERKINKEAFKNEAKRQMKITMNNRVNIQGNKIL